MIDPIDTLTRDFFDDLPHDVLSVASLDSLPSGQGGANLTDYFKPLDFSAFPSCPVCSSPVIQPAKAGRPSLFCSSNCRLRNHRNKNKQTEQATAKPKPISNKPKRKKLVLPSGSVFYVYEGSELYQPTKFELTKPSEPVVCKSFADVKAVLDGWL